MRAFHPEDKARLAIDALLTLSGWLVQSRDEMNLSAGTGVALREFATASGPVDYQRAFGQGFPPCDLSGKTVRQGRPQPRSEAEPQQLRGLAR
jgi:hypothetical protein